MNLKPIYSLTSDRDPDDDSGVRKKEIPNWIDPIKQLLDNFSEKEIWMLQFFLEGDGRNRGKMVKLGQEFGPEFWDMEAKIDRVREEYNCSPEVIKSAIQISRLGMPISKLDLHSHSLPKRKQKMPELVAAKPSDTEKKPQLIDRVRTWMKQGLGAKND